MSIITKTQAREIAVKLTEYQQKELEGVTTEANKYFTEVYLSTLPECLKEAFEKYPLFFRGRSSFQLCGNGFNWQSVSTSKSVPYINNTFSPSKEEAAKLLLLINKVEAKRSELKRLIIEIEVALNSLKTFKRISESFPEASNYLSYKVNTALAVNLSEIREKLKQ